jgi:hypothetical protein
MPLTANGRTAGSAESGYEETSRKARAAGGGRERDPALARYLAGRHAAGPRRLRALRSASIAQRGGITSVRPEA